MQRGRLGGISLPRTRWPSRLVATAAENRLSFRHKWLPLGHIFGAVGYPAVLEEFAPCAFRDAAQLVTGFKFATAQVVCEHGEERCPLVGWDQSQQISDDIFDISHDAVTRPPASIARAPLPRYSQTGHIAHRSVRAASALAP